MLDPIRRVAARALVRTPPAPAASLARMAGEWDLTVKFWMGPGEPTTSTATSTATMILGGRYRFASQDEHVYESYEKGPDGSERKTMEIVYRRKG